MSSKFLLHLLGLNVILSLLFIDTQNVLLLEWETQFTNFWKMQDFVLNSTKHFPNIICFQFHHKPYSDLLLSLWSKVCGSFKREIFLLFGISWLNSCFLSSKWSIRRVFQNGEDGGCIRAMRAKWQARNLLGKNATLSGLRTKAPVIDFSLFCTLCCLDCIIKGLAPVCMQHTCQEMVMSWCKFSRRCFVQSCE
jgi:hypothetical protein